jgi:FlaA1/EpsC-like NDP-sugar epimerase
MNLATQISTETLAPLVTGRDKDLFLADLETQTEAIQSKISEQRVLVIGGAGSVGTATVQLLTQFGPRTLHIVDQNENKLAELIRDLRSKPGELSVEDLRTFPIDYGSSLTHRLLCEMDPYDFVFNFAALKHVRSEKDSYSLLQMLDTNVIKAGRFLSWLAEKSPECGYFCVSTDKAANPVSLMGASKRIMEHVIFSGEVAPELRSHVTSARFANVAFSDGSLLDSFLKRLQTRRALAVPRNTRRFFISLAEAGQICLIAAVAAPHRHLLVSRLDPAKDLRDLESVACAILGHFGYEPRVYLEPEEAKANFERDVKKGNYPLVLTERDTSGEKEFEEFVGDGETAVEIGFENLIAVQYGRCPGGAVSAFLKEIERLISNPAAAATTVDIAGLIATIVPELRHVATGKSLDDRM